VLAKFGLAWNFSRQFRGSEFYARAADQLGRARAPRIPSSSSIAAPHKYDPQSTDDLCDRLLEHMLECDACLNPKRKCSVYETLAAKINSEGGPSKPAVYAI
jgi:hypothetical protein